MSRFVHRRPAAETTPQVCLSVILDPFDDTDGVLLEDHLTNEGYPWVRSESLFYPEDGINTAWTIQGNELLPVGFINGGLARLFSYVNVPVDAEKYEVYLTFSLEVETLNYLEVGIITDLQPLASFPSNYGWVQHYLYLTTDPNDTPITNASSTQDTEVEDGQDDTGTEVFREGSYGDPVASPAILAMGTHVMKVVIDKSSGTMIATIYLDDVLMTTRTFDQTSYDFYGTIPLPAQSGFTGWNLYHQGDDGDVKVLEYEVRICSGEELPPYVAPTPFGWDPATLTANTNLTNGGIDLDSTPSDFLNRSCLSLERGDSDLVYAEIWLPGQDFIEDNYDGFDNEPIEVGLAPTGVLNLSFRPSDLAGVPAALSIYGLYVLDVDATPASGEMEIFKASVQQPGQDADVFGGLTGDTRRRIGIAWDVVNGHVYFSQGGTWVYGNPDGSPTPKNRLTLAGAPTNLRLFAYNFVSARGGFTADGLEYPIPAGYTAWDGTT